MIIFELNSTSNLNSDASENTISKLKEILSNCDKVLVVFVVVVHQFIMTINNNSDYS